MADDEERANLFRILIATDNHLGVWEKDEVRKDDSFKTFEEILQLAVEHEADAVLLGGDLFHDNKPSRATLQRTMDILSKFVLNDRPIGFQVLSDQATNFVAKKVNFEDPNLNVGLPIFTIHGNHDDPTGVDSLSAVDLLSTAGLVNYFGKFPFLGSGIGKVRLHPVLLAKGSTQLALYGLGNLRDERLVRMFATPGCVEWVRPAEAPGYALDDWLNLFVLHQNRVQHGGPASKNYLKEDHLAEFLDIVVWGHEHECILEPWTSSVTENVNILQPGSSVATTLSEGESRPKHVQLLEVLGSQWRLVKLPLQTVRPFVFDQVVLAEELEVEADDQEGLAAFLERRVEDATRRAMRSAPPSAQATLPLVRLRVDYTGFSTINVQRFGQKFVGKVANPHDVLLWHKAVVRKEKGPAEAALPGGAEATAAPQERGVEDLIAEHLVVNLQIMSEPELADALHEFVEKDEKGALADCISRSLAGTSAVAGEDPVIIALADEGGELDEALQQHAAARRAQQDVHPGARRQAQQAAAPAQPSAAGPAAMDVDAPSQRTANGAGPARGRQSTLDAALSRSQRAAAAGPASQAAPAGRAAGCTAGRAGSNMQNGAAAGASNSTQRGGTQGSQAQRRAPSGRAAAGRATARMQVDSDADSQPDDDEISNAGEELVDLIDSSSADEAPTPQQPAAVRRGAAAGRRPATGAAAGRKRPAATQSTGAGSTAAAASGGGGGGAFIDESDEEDAAAARRKPGGRALPGSFARSQGRASQQPSQRTLPGRLRHAL